MTKREEMDTEFTAQVADHGIDKVQYVLDFDPEVFREPGDYFVSVKDVMFDGEADKIMVVLEPHESEVNG